MGFFTDENLDGGRTLETICFHVPPGLRQHFTARRRQGDETCHRRPCRKTDRALLGKPHQIQQPLGRDFFGCGSGWRTLVDRRVLPPSRRKPVRGDACGVRTAHDPREEVGPDIADKTGLSCADEVFDDRVSVPTFFR